MFVESLAGKSGALHAIAQDSTPFQFDEQHTAVDHFGRELTKAGYNYYGTYTPGTKCLTCLRRFLAEFQSRVLTILTAPTPSP
jgi:hypothetical protein